VEDVLLLIALASLVALILALVAGCAALERSK
jgi:hypothetical protein